MKNHNLKTWPEFFQAVKRGDKTFEERIDDRGYEVGDTLTLQEFDPDKQEYTGDVLVKRVPYLLREPYAKDGHVIMSLSECGACKECMRHYEYYLDRSFCINCEHINKEETNA